MAAALDTCIGIVRFRKGPEDLPASTSLLAVAVAASVILDAATLAMMPESSRPPAVPILAISIAATLLFVTLVLRAAGHPERFTQTATAIFGVQVVLGPVLMGSAWLVLTYESDPSWEPVVKLVRAVVEIWALVILARVLRSATGWPVMACVALLIAAELATLLLISGLLPPSPEVVTPPPVPPPT